MEIKGLKAILIGGASGFARATAERITAEPSFRNGRQSPTRAVTAYLDHVLCCKARLQ